MAATLAHFSIVIGTQGKLLAIDRDQEALARFEEQFSSKKRPRAVLMHGSYAELAEHLREAQVAPASVDAILADLGFSSDQIEAPERGFSFQLAGPLDMRLDARKGRQPLSLWLGWTKRDL